MSIVDDTAPGAGSSQEDLRRYLDAKQALEATTN